MLRMLRIPFPLFADGMIGLGDKPVFIQLLEAVFGHSNRVATAKWKMCKIEYKDCDFSQYCIEYQVIAANHD